MKNDIWKKALVCGLMILLIGVSGTQGINCNNKSNNIENYEKEQEYNQILLNDFDETMPIELTRYYDNLKFNFSPTDIIIKFRKSVVVNISQNENGFILTGLSSIDQLNTNYNVVKIEKVFTEKCSSDFSNTYVFKFPKTIDIRKCIVIYNKDPNVEYVDLNTRYQTCITPNDPFFSSQWALHQANDHDIDAPEAWDIETGDPDVVIAIIDTGVDYTHPDLADNMWVNDDEIPGNGIDDDDNGYIDDVMGWDFFNNDNDPIDDNGHGTACSAIASATTNNSQYIAGVSWYCKIMPIKVMDETGGGYASGIASGIEYAVDNGADVISMSFTSVIPDTTVKNALDYASQHGVVLVAAQGNLLEDRKTYPAIYDNVISVAATTNTDARAEFSCFGSWTDVAAPGEHILTLLPTYHVYMNDEGYQLNWDYLSGTSFACPHVSGLIGLMISHNPFLSPDEIRTILHSTTDPVISDQYIGTGRINAYEALTLNPHLIAKLNSYLDERFIGPFSLEIRGTAKSYSDNFRSYEVYYGEGIYPNNWILIEESSSPVEDGLLAVWDLSDLQNEGYYTIKLAATSDDLKVVWDYALVYFDPLLTEGWPSYLSTGAIFASPNAFDFDGDGKQEIVQCTYGTWTSWDDLNDNGQVFVINSGGDIVTNWPFETEWPIEFPAAIGDLNDDGEAEIVVADWQYLYVLHYDGTLLWKKTSDAFLPSPALVDLDNDGYLEIVATGQGGKIFAINYDGTDVEGWPITINPLFYGDPISVPAIADLDNNGDLEVVVLAPDHKVYVYNHDGSIYDGWPFQLFVEEFQYQDSGPAIADFDGDGNLEIIVDGKRNPSGEDNLWMFESDGSVCEGWPQTTENGGSHNFGLGDIDFDGLPEITLNRENHDNLLYAFNGDGTQVSGFPLSIGDQAGKGLFTYCSIANVDSDPWLEIIGRSQHEVRLFKVDQEGGPYEILEDWPNYVRNNGIFAIHMPGSLIADINADGYIDIINPSLHEAVHCWTPGGESDPDTLEWTMFQHDPQHTGYYIPPSNVPPNKPNKPMKETIDPILREYWFTTSTTDENDDGIYYVWEWGDGSNSGWIGPYNSGEECETSHAFSGGTYYVRVRAKDVYGTMSEWSDPLEIAVSHGCVEETQINMASGSSPSVKNIEDIEVGDYISSYDLELQEVVSAEVIAVHEYTEFTELPEPPLDINYNFEGNIKVTSNHFLFINGTEWMEADDAGIDYYLLENTPGTNDTSLKPITSINELRSFSGVIYDLEIRPLESGNVSGYFADGILVGYKRQAIMSVCTMKDEYSNNETINITDPPGDPPPPDDPPSEPSPIGYELLDDNKVLHIWNRYDSYYFNTSSGIQLTNYYNEYWSHNVMMLGYYNNDQWNLIYRTDELSGFNKNIETDNETFVNATLWKDLTYNGYDFRLAIRYHLGIDDNELTIIPYIKNLEDAIPYVIGFAWEINDIQIDMTPENDYIEINDTSFYLNETIDVTYTNLSDGRFRIKENMGNNSYKDLYLRWNKTVPYKVMIKSREGQYNAPVTLAIRVGTLNQSQEKQVMLFWHDASGLEITVYSTNDSYLRKHYPNNNYGNETYMWIDPKLTQTNRMLVQMDLPSELIDAYIESATLKIRYYTHSGINPRYRTHECWRIEEPWDENGVTWNNQPDLDALEDYIVLGEYGIKSWDDVTDNVQDFVEGDLDNYGWLLGDENEGTALSRAAKYFSREKSGTIYDPKLVIEYLAPPETQTNPASYVEESYVRMNGEVISDGGDDCQYSFSYDAWIYGEPVSSSTSWTGSVATDESFYTYLSSLDEGRHGSYYARLRHSVYPSVVRSGISTGFLTKPDTLTGFTATAYEEQVNLTWSNNDGGDGAYIEWFTSSDSSWDPGDHTKVDADGYVAGESFIHENRIPGTSYYYKAWAYADDAGWRSCGNSTAPFGDAPKTAETTTGVTTSVDAISPYIQVSSPLTVTASGSPDLDNVSLWYQYSSDNSSWVVWNNSSNPDTSSPWSWDFDFPEGRGYYEFYSIGTKNDIVESSPSSADAQCFYENQSKINNTGSTDIEGYLLMQVHYFNERKQQWIVADDTVNETMPRIIKARGQLGLDTIFNGLVNTNDLSEFGSGTYRVYVAFRDIDGNVLICERKLEAWCEFNITFD